MKGNISKKALVIWEIGLAVLVVVLVGLVLLTFYPRTFLWYALLWVLGFAYTFFAFLYLPLLYLSCQYRTTDQIIEYRTGLIYLSRKQIRRQSIMHVSLIRTPISRLSHTSSLLISSMGGQMMIPWLPVRTAERLLEDITPYPAENRKQEKSS